MANKKYKSVEKNEIEKSELKEYYIAFLDILGYKNKIKSCSTIDEESNYLEYINNSFNDAIKMIYNKVSENNDNTNINKETINRSNKDKLKGLVFNTFSDNIVLAIPKKNVTNYSFFDFIKLIGAISYLMLSKYQLLLRGGVSEGNYYQNNNISFGSGLVKAYELEYKAKYPRIIFDRSMIEDILTNKQEESSFLIFKKCFYNCFHNKENLNNLFDITLDIIIKISFFNCNSLDDNVCTIINFFIDVLSSLQSGNFFNRFKNVKDVDFLIELIEKKYNLIYEKSINYFYDEALILYDENDDFFTLNPFEKNTSVLYKSEPKCYLPKRFIKYPDGSFKYLEMEDKDHYIYCHTINDFMISKEENVQQLNEIKEFIVQQIKSYEDVLCNNEDINRDTVNNILEKYKWMKKFYNLNCKNILKRNFINNEEYKSLLI